MKNCVINLVPNVSGPPDDIVRYCRLVLQASPQSAIAMLARHR